ncbi:uncharacterized protein IUM83_12760 [Phytophthora cinnamomi]|uniref:uncharacterized protein n=1 Tax=Phytophthora cinnamomi TaxID=4785 RepID=UPI003559E71B|nr:hypothetical protein IUM83_12760 [Phytophthora cinnamomi]
MSKQERNTSLYTLLTVLMQVPVDRKRGSGERERFHYYLPFVGQVCCPVFARCYGVVPMTLQRYKKLIRDGIMAVKDHGNKLNKNAAQKKIDGTVQKYYISDKYTLLAFTWDVIWDEMHKFVESGLMVRQPASPTMRKLLTLHCAAIRIRSLRSNVRDICAIYHAGMRGGVTTDKTEALGRHTESARQMRREYKGDKSSCSSEHAVIVMDYPQNLTIPSVANTPSQW